MTRLVRILAAGALLIGAAVCAQQQIIGGRALDNNLQVGSAGFNYNARRPGTGLGVPSYKVNNAVRRNAGTGGLSNSTYWTGAPAPSSTAMGYQQPGGRTGITRATPTGAVYNPLENPLYRPTQSALVQRGTGYVTVNRANGMSGGGYSPMR